MNTSPQILAAIFFIGVVGLVLLLPALEMLVRRAVRIGRSEIAVGEILRWEGPPPSDQPIDPEALLYTPFVRFTTKEGIETVAQVSPPFRRIMTNHYRVGSAFGFRYLLEDPENGFDAEWNQTYQAAAIRAAIGGALMLLTLILLAVT